jgi:rRNA maturation protein Rpf1
VDLIDALTSIPQREKGGSTAVERFDFQTCWGVSHLLKLHNSGEQYAVGFEFHDDIVVLDDKKKPSELRFYQLKTASSGSWTVTRLTRRKTNSETNKKEPSIAAKMFDNRLKFGKAATHLGFVSNKPCSFIDESKYPCSFSESEEAEYKKFVSALKTEISSFKDSDAKLYRYHIADFDLNDYEDTLVGRFVTFIEVNCNLEVYNPKVFYLFVMNECKNRSKHLKDVDNFNDLLAAKFVSREDMTTWLSKFEIRTKGRPQWSAVLHDLMYLSAGRRHVLKQHWDQYELQKSSETDLAIGKLRDRVRKASKAITLKMPDANMKELIEAILPKLRDIADGLGYPVSDDHLTAVFLFEFYAHE